MSNLISESSNTTEYPNTVGLLQHLLPTGNGKGVVTQISSDFIFGPEGLGLASSIWMKILSFLARTGIQEQTGSKSGETDIDACVKGWGQGACSSRVFDVKKGVDEMQLVRLVTHLEGIAKELGIPNQRITDKVLAVFVSTQDIEPYSTWNGIRTAQSVRDRFNARFRGHVQWQGFHTLCGQMDYNGIKHVTPELLRTFFTSEEPFFQTLIERRSRLRDGTLVAGDKSGILADAPEYVDLTTTDQEYIKNKSGLWVILKIIVYILFPRRSQLGPLLQAT